MRKSTNSGENMSLLSVLLLRKQYWLFCHFNFISRITLNFLFCLCLIYNHRLNVSVSSQHFIAKYKPVVMLLYLQEVISSQEQNSHEKGQCSYSQRLQQIPLLLLSEDIKLWQLMNQGAAPYQTLTILLLQLCVLNTCLESTEPTVIYQRVPMGRDIM